MTDDITLSALLETLETSGEGARLTMDEVLSVIGRRGFGPLMLILALIAALPTGAVPGVPTICGLSIALVATQLVFGKTSPWLPARLRRLGIDRDRYARVADRILPWTRRIDRLVKPRLTVLAVGVAPRVVGLACLAFALCMPPLELLPFAAAAPAAGIALMSLGLAGRDGLWVLLGLLPATFGFWLVFKLFG